MNLLYLASNYRLEKAEDILEYHVKHWPPVARLHVVLRTLAGGGLRPATLATPALPEIHFHPTGSANGPAGLWDLWREARGVLDREAVDLMVCDDPGSAALVGYLLRRRYGVPTCVHYITDIVDNRYWIRERAKNRLANRYLKWLIRRADSLRVVSETNKRKVVSRFGIPAERVFVIPNRKGVERFVAGEAEGLREQYLSRGFDRIALYVGRLEAQKDVGNLIRAVPRVRERCPRALFLIVGDGSEAAGLKALCAALGVEGNVLFTGFVDQQEMPRYYKACDLFVLPSIYEDRAGVLVEAAAAGRPMVATDTLGASEVVRVGETGYLAPTRDPDALADHMVRLLEDRELAERMGAAAQRHILAYLDEESIPARMLEMWRYTAGRGRPGPGGAARDAAAAAAGAQRRR
ncbi:MAG TPA: glycosyltransferase family 4 protein [Candidatus Methylomirabilis sp.]